MRAVTWPLAAAVGVAVAALVALVPLEWPALAVAVGAVAVAGLLLVAGRGRRHFGAAGAAYCLVFALLVLAGWPLSGARAGSPGLALATLGGASALALAAWAGAVRLGQGLLRRLVRGGLRSKLAAVRGVAKLLGSLRTIVGLVGRLARVGALLAVGILVATLVWLVALVLGGLGVARPVPWLGGEVDAVLLLFVAVTLGWFHALDAAQSTWIATREGVGQGKVAGSRVAAAIRRRRGGSDVDDRERP